MPDFDPPFAQNGDRRFPTTNEQSLGWPCGPIDQALLNGIFHIHNGNIGRVISEAGVTGPDGDLTKLFRAIEALINAATGGGTADDFILMAQARARLPIFPEVQSSDGRIAVTAPSTGTVRLAGGVTFLHRGVFTVTTTQSDFSTDPSRIYHLRWNPADGFQLLDLASGSYNPGSLTESNVAFDSAFDSMLVARVVTNSSNVATITTLANRAQGLLIERVGRSSTALIGGTGMSVTDNYTLNFARTPVLSLEGWSENTTANSDDGVETQISAFNRTRYGFSVNIFTTSGTLNQNYAPTYTYNAVA